MQGFQISCAKRINDALSRRAGYRCRGRVFSDRYHAVPLTTPRQVRNALGYVLNNWRKHGEDGGVFATRQDPYSTGAYFGGWFDEPRFLPLPPGTPLLPVSFPKSWMMRIGWRRHGLLSPWARPGPLTWPGAPLPRGLRQRAR